MAQQKEKLDIQKSDTPEKISFFNSLRFKFILFILILIVFVMTAVSIATLNSQEKSLRYELIKKGELVTKQLSQSIIPDIFPNLDLLPLSDKIDKIIENESIVYAYVLNDHSKLIIHSDKKVDSRKNELADEIIHSKNKKIKWRSLTDAKNQEIIEFVSPVLVSFKNKTKVLGTAIIGISAQHIKNAINKARNKIIIISAIAITIGIVCVIILVGFIVKPIEKISNGAKIIGTGNLDYRFDIKSKNELGLLSNTFNDMLVNLNQAQELKIKQKQLARELSIANEIQQTLLPKADPEVDGYSFGSYYRSAKEVGGDYYDWILVDDTKLGIVCADVSGKGVPAAFIMSITRSLLRSYAVNNTDILDVIKKTNAAVKQDIRRGMFITMFYGIYDFMNDTLDFTLAGHNPLLIYRADSNSIEDIMIKGPSVGLFKAKRFDKIIKNKSTILNPGDFFVQYSDGVTEAMNEKEEQYTLDRLKDIIKGNPDKNAKELTDIIVNDTDKHAGNAEQSDDITIVILKREQI